MELDPVVIVGAARTPMGGFQGDLKDITTTALAARRSAPRWSAPASRARDVGEVLMGCVLPAGLGQAPARQAALGLVFPIASRARRSTRCAAPG